MRTKLRHGGAGLARMAPALAGLTAALALGSMGPPLLGPWQWLVGTPWVGLLGGCVALQVGLLAYLLASSAGTNRDRMSDALIASLIAGAMVPGCGAATLLVPALLSLSLFRHARVAAVVVPISLATALVGDAALGTFASAVMVSTAIRLLVGPAVGAANDNVPGRGTVLAWLLHELPASVRAPVLRHGD